MARIVSTVSTSLFTVCSLSLSPSLEELLPMRIIGSAPDISGKGIVNPVAAILSVAMMLQYSFGMFDEARIIEKAVANVIEAGVRTGDIGGKATTVEVGDAVVVELEKLLK